MFSLSLEDLPWLTVRIDVSSTYKIKWPSEFSLSLDWTKQNPLDIRPGLTIWSVPRTVPVTKTPTFCLHPTPTFPFPVNKVGKDLNGTM